MIKKLFISQPMRGLTDEEILKAREEIKENKNYELIMIMGKEMKRLKSIIRFNKALINVYDYMNFISKTNKYDKKIEEYQNRLSELYERVQEIKNGGE